MRAGSPAKRPAQAINGPLFTWAFAGAVFYRIKKSIFVTDVRTLGENHKKRLPIGSLLDAQPALILIGLRNVTDENQGLARSLSLGAKFNFHYCVKFSDFLSLICEMTIIKGKYAPALSDGSASDLRF